MLGAPEGFCQHDPFSSLAGQLSLQKPLQLFSAFEAFR